MFFLIDISYHHMQVEKNQVSADYNISNVSRLDKNQENNGSSSNNSSFLPFEQLNMKVTKQVSVSELIKLMY